MGKGDELALDLLERLSTIYNNMGTGLLTFHFIKKKETFIVHFRHIPTAGSYSFEFDNKVTVAEFDVTIKSVLKSKIGSGATRGMAS